MSDVTVLTEKKTDSATFRPRLAPIDPSDFATPEPAVDELVSLFKLLSDETRLRILYFLTQRPELHVRALCELLGQSQPAVSHHLALLLSAELIDRRREGKHNYYALRAGRLTGLLERCFAHFPQGNRRALCESVLDSAASV
jgi:DNA-binding transcriptional ArsR family regulator